MVLDECLSDFSPASEGNYPICQILQMKINGLIQGMIRDITRDPTVIGKCTQPNVLYNRSHSEVEHLRKYSML